MLRSHKQNNYMICFSHRQRSGQGIGLFTIHKQDCTHPQNKAQTFFSHRSLPALFIPVKYRLVHGIYWALAASMTFTRSCRKNRVANQLVDTGKSSTKKAAAMGAKS